MAQFGFINYPAEWWHFDFGDRVAVGLDVRAGAVRLGVARSLNGVDEELNRPALKKAGLLTRDARVPERKKAGLKKARKAPQYSKR